MKNQDKKILILVPAYNAGKYLAELTSRISKAAPNCDLLIINDGSIDNSADILETLDVEYLTNDPNMGKGATLQRGFDYAVEHGYDYVLTIDADLQHLPEEIPRFLDYRPYADLYIGTRDLRSMEMPPHRKLSNYLTSLIISIFSGRRIRDSQTGYRMISTELIKALKQTYIGYMFESEQLFLAGKMNLDIAEIPISTIYEDSPSFINPLMDTARFVKLIWKRIMS
ncbi:MAG TPA: glycosyltransferase family 2 protein [candidate division Zixibacteria bacterium]|nr:glycosyltransferase family 2 protein [candidate division Zixibacteria bacterium]